MAEKSGKYGNLIKAAKQSKPKDVEPVSECSLPAILEVLEPSEQFAEHGLRDVRRIELTAQTGGEAVACARQHGAHVLVVKPLDRGRVASLGGAQQLRELRGTTLHAKDPSNCCSVSTCGAVVAL